MVDADLAAAYQRALAANATLTETAVKALFEGITALDYCADRDSMYAAYEALVKRFGGYAAQVALEFYAKERGVQVDELEDEAYTPTVPEDGNGALYAFDANASVTASDIASHLAGKAIQRTYERADAVLIANAQADPLHPKWAIVPHAGACDWCRMLGSRGFVYRSEASAALQRHASCKCTSVVDFDSSNPSLSGYDPDRLYDEYRTNHADWSKRAGGGKVREIGTVRTKSGVTFQGTDGLLRYVKAATSKRDARKRAEVALSVGGKLAPAGSKAAEELSQAIADNFSRFG